MKAPGGFVGYCTVRCGRHGELHRVRFYLPAIERHFDKALLKMRVCTNNTNTYSTSTVLHNNYSVSECPSERGRELGLEVDASA